MKRLLYRLMQRADRASRTRTQHACTAHLVWRRIRALPVNLDTPWYSLFKVRTDWSEVSPPLDAVVLELVRR